MSLLCRVPKEAGLLKVSGPQPEVQSRVKSTCSACPTRTRPCAQPEPFTQHGVPSVVGARVCTGEGGREGTVVPRDADLAVRERGCCVKSEGGGRACTQRHGPGRALLSQQALTQAAWV